MDDTREMRRLRTLADNLYDEREKLMDERSDNSPKSDEQRTIDALTVCANHFYSRANALYNELRRKSDSME